uniref:VWFA domain-containing protein n=1 Tax=Meloidogyne enterolobii TaxID=390850 RepID=A0A6V7W6A0_MELEN|nr:unnamed protein product [Meloidogyne enterolobii]
MIQSVEWEECSDDKALPVVVLFGLSMFSRACIGIGTLLLAAFFFWYLEANKRRNHGEKDEDEKEKTEKKKLLKLPSEEEEDFSAETILEMASKEVEQKARTERKSSSKRKLSAEEINALMAWKAEVHKLEQERFRAASQEPIELTQQQVEDTTSVEQQSMAPLITIASTSTETAATVLEKPQQEQQIPSPIYSTPFGKTQEERFTYEDNLLPDEERDSTYNLQENQNLQKEKNIPQQTFQHKLERQVEMNSVPLMWDIPERETERGAQSTTIDQLNIKSSQYGEPGKTPTSTPQDGVPLIQKLPELAAHYRRMADQLTQKLLTELDEIGKGGFDPATVTAVLQDKHRSDIDEGLAETGAPQDIQQHLARQLDSHVASIVVRELRRRSSTTALLKLEQQQQELLNKQKEAEKEGGGGGPILKKDSSSSDDNEFKMPVFLHFPPPLTTTSPASVVVVSQEQHQSKHSPPPSQPPPQPYLLLQQPLISPQSGGSITTDEEEYDEGREGQTNIRISLFSNNGDGDGMSTTADDIEFVPRGSTQYQKVETTKIQEQQKQQQNHHPLNAEEAKQVAALLQEYETPTTATIELEKHKQVEEERQKHSKKIKTTREEEIISLPESAKQTPGGSISIPESPASLGFDIISFPQSPIEKETAQTDDTVIIETAEINLNIQQQKQQSEQSLEQQKLATVVFPSSQSQVASTYLQQSPQTKPPTSPIKQQTAESLLQEAIDYMQQQEGHLPLREQQQQKQQKRISLRQSGEFVMEEEMLESEEIPGGPPVIIHSRQKGTPVFGRKSSKELTDIDKNKTAMAVLSPSSPQGLLAESAGGSTPGADGTSKQIVTNEVFDKPDPILLFEDGDDDVTHAPEIQSMEIPPDQLSQADSLNLVDENFSEHQELGGGGGVTTTNLELKRQLSEPQQPQIPPPKPPRTSLHFEDNEMAEILKQQKLEEDSKNFVGQTEEKKHQQQIFNQNTQLNKQNEQIIVLPPHPPEYQQQKQQIYPDQKQNPQAPQFLLRSTFTDDSTSSLDTTSIRQSSLLSVVGVTSTQEMLLKLQSLEALSEAMRKAGLESSNLIFGIDYTASNKYQGERSFNGRSLHSVDQKGIENPYQQVIKIMGRTLAPFAGTQYGIPAFGFGDASTGDWSVFSLNGTTEGECNDLDDVLRIYNQVTPKVDLSGPTNFAPLIYRSMEICYARKDYHILVIIADGQVTNERATRKAIVAACQYPLSIIVVGVGDGPWDMMKVFDESLPKRPWDNFHFVEFHSLFTDENMNQQSSSKELSFAINSLLEIPDQAKFFIKMLGKYFF